MIKRFSLCSICTQKGYIKTSSRPTCVYSRYFLGLNLRPGRGRGGGEAQWRDQD